MTRAGLYPAPSGADCRAMSEEIPSYGAVTPFDVLVNHFEANHFTFHTDPQSKLLQLFISGDCAIYNCRLQLTHDDDLIQVRVHYPVAARDRKIRPLVAEVIARANHGLAVGAFDIDVDTGEMSFHAGQVIRGGELEDEIIGKVFSTAVSTVDRYFSAIMRVMFAGHTPADAVYLSELDVHSEAPEIGNVPESPAPRALKPAVKKRRSRRRDRRSKTTRDLPGLFDEPMS